MILKGKAWKVGDHVDTDAIIPARYLTVSDERKLAAHCLEDLLPELAERIVPGDILVAGRDFGCGSSREHAPRVLRTVGFSGVIARSFARIFFRNALNLGLPLLMSQEAPSRIRAGDLLEVDPAAGRITNLSRGEEYPCQPLAPFMIELVHRGGLLNLIREGGWR